MAQAAGLLGRTETFVKNGLDNQTEAFPVVVALVGKVRTLLAEDWSSPAFVDI